MASSQATADEEESKPFSGEIRSDEIFALYRRGVAAQHMSNFREAFRLYKIVVPFMGAHPLIWIRIMEVIVYALYGRSLIRCCTLVDESCITGSGKNRRVMLPCDRLPHTFAHLEEEGITLEFAGHAALIACSILSKSHDRPLYKHALKLAIFILLRQGRFNIAQYYTSELEKIGEGDKDQVLVMMCKAEMMVVSDIKSRRSGVSELRRANLKADPHDQELELTLTFNTALGHIALKKFDKAAELWRAFPRKQNRDVRLLGVYTHAKLGMLEEARLIAFDKYDPDAPAPAAEPAPAST